MSKLFLPLFFFGFSIGLFSQSLPSFPEYKIGDVVLDSVDVYNSDGKLYNLKIPGNCNLIIYRYTWRDIGKGVDTKDSIVELEKRISSILSQRQFQKTKLICISYNMGKDFETWKQKMKEEKLFKESEAYTVEYINTNGITVSELKLKKMLSKITIIEPTGRIVRWSSFINRFDYKPKNKALTILKGKLFTEQKGSTNPLNEAVVSIKSSNGDDTIATTKTNKSGEFELSYRGNQEDYIIKVHPKESTTSNVLMTTSDGREIFKIEKGGQGFEYRLLKPKVILLSEMQAEDVEFKFDSFNETDSKELTTIEFIFYEFSKAEITQESVPTINKIIKILKENPKVKLEVISHSDSQGNDEFNLDLSKKRAKAVVDFLIFNEVPANRLIATGMGEKEIRNKCVNGVTCTDAEHGYNRRTVFKFIR